MTSKNRAEAVLYESEATLRLVDQEIHDLRGAYPLDARLPSAGFGDVPHMLERANQQILDVLAHLRETRTALQSTAFAKLQTTHDKIQEVTSATEDAAITIMDACDRATGVVDELDAIDEAEAPDRAKASALRGNLRDEIFRMMGALQFQDITSQQLSHASAALVEMEQRLAEVAQLFDSNLVFDPLIRAPSRVPASAPLPGEQACDPEATTQNAEDRQALADEIFTSVTVTAA